MSTRRITRSIIIAIEGADGTGKSHHAKALADALAAQGYPVELFQHPRPPRPDNPIARALWYRDERTLLGARLATATPRIVVADRWRDSTLATAEAEHTTPAAVMHEIVDDEWRAWEARRFAGVYGVTLDAPDAVLDARIHARGTAATPADLHPRRALVRAWYRANARRACFKTDEAREFVTECLVGWAWPILVNLYDGGEMYPAHCPGFDANGSPVT